MKNFLEQYNIEAYIRDALSRMSYELFQEVYLSYPELSPLLGDVVWPLGKSIRPKFVLMLAFLFSSDPLANSGVMALCKTIECLHVASLLHDDVLDAGIIRRSRSCFYLSWGQRRSILLGDYLLSIALRYLSNIDDCSLLAIVQNAITEMTLGQIQEESMSWSKGIKDYEQLASRKTSSLFSAIAQSVCKLFQVEDTHSKILEFYAMLTGLCFQLQDDIQDYTGTKKDKKRFQDFFQSRVTAPLLWLRECVPQDIQIKIKTYWDSPTSDHANDIYDLMVKYNIFRYGEDKINSYKLKAYQSLKKYWPLENVQLLMNFFPSFSGY
ncbi:heptaprenyl diphosphate synthase component 2 [Holospora obtusa F1]|uniref:Heptaprenyl diphosphate synthase component 2 n=1 Tax=Holospora obtusa F1 TaxID=1399147 RepID=W6TDP0_HOLOB|nr:polyprenyl synthetase family protein [Holospora obtusa]ETZ06871.1 heptaprenyl diphosphate synthase component 2 [Holospora obtusa F1]